MDLVDLLFFLGCIFFLFSGKPMMNWIGISFIIHDKMKYAILVVAVMWFHFCFCSHLVLLICSSNSCFRCFEWDPIWSSSTSGEYTFLFVVFSCTWWIHITGCCCHRWCQWHPQGPCKGRFTWWANFLSRPSIPCPCCWGYLIGFFLWWSPLLIVFV